MPDFTSEFPKCDFLEVDFPPPSKVTHSKIPKNSCKRDKATKNFVGLLRAREYSPKHIMFFDADDLLSCNIAEYVNSKSSFLDGSKVSYYIQDGYIYGDGGITLKKKSHFHLACGSSIILSYEILVEKLGSALELPLSVSQKSILDSVDNDFLIEIIGDHSSTKKYLESIDKLVLPLPFPAAIWVVNTGENRSVDKGLSTFFGMLITSKEREEFSLDSPDVNLQRIATHFIKFIPAAIISLRIFIVRDSLWRIRAFLKSCTKIFLSFTQS
jgi:hypothetical protein